MTWLVSSRGSRSWLAALIVVALCGTLGAFSDRAAGKWFGVFRGESSTGEQELARPKWVPQKIHALGRLEPRGEVVQLAPPSGNDGARVETLMVGEGDDVAAGTLVALMDTHDRRSTEMAEAEARLRAAEARLLQTRAGAKTGEILAQQAAVDQLAQQKSVARRELERADRFRNQRAISDEDFDKHKWAYDRLVFESRRAEQLLASVSEVRDTDVRVQELEVKTAEAAVAAARSRLAATEVRSPSGGRVLKIHARPGERVGDRGLMELGDVAQMHAVAEVFEGDVAVLAPGLSAEVVLDSTGERLQGRIADLGHLVSRKVVLSNDPVSDTDARVIEVRVRLNPVDSARVARLSNARVEVSIDVSRPGVGQQSAVAPRNSARRE